MQQSNACKILKGSYLLPRILHMARPSIKCMNSFRNVQKFNFICGVFFLRNDQNSLIREPNTRRKPTTVVQQAQTATCLEESKADGYWRVLCRKIKRERERKKNNSLYDVFGKGENSVEIFLTLLHCCKEERC